jgi:hypothetical protein
LLLIVDADDTILDVKTRIEARDGYTRDQQRLTYGDRELEDSVSLKECGVVDDDVTFSLLLHKKERLVLHMRSLYGKEFDLPCESTEHVRDVKLRIEATESIPADKQRLVFSGKELQDKWTLDECGLRHKSLVMMVARGSTLTSRKMQAESRPKRKATIARMQERCTGRKRLTDSPTDSVSLAKMIKIEQDSGSGGLSHSSGSTASNESTSDCERDDGMDNVVADSPAGLTPCTPNQLLPSGQNLTPPFLETNFISLLSDYQDVSGDDCLNRGTNFEWETLLAPVPSDAKKMTLNSVNRKTTAVVDDLGTTKVGNPMERTLSPVHLDVLPAEGSSPSQQDASNVRKKRATTIKQEPLDELEQPLEEKMFKRMQKNRASAERSRQRKQAYLEEVEFKLSVATSENLNLRERIVTLENELQRFIQLFTKQRQAHGSGTKTSPSALCNFQTPNRTSMIET